MPEAPIQPPFAYISVDSATLEISFHNRRASGMVIPSTGESAMSSLILLQFMYPTVYKRDEKARKESGSTVRVNYSLVPPPLWLTAVGAVMWEGILQGMAWDIVKAAVSSALTKLRGKGLATEITSRRSHVSERTLRAGWNAYSESGAKQYEMFLTLKSSYRKLPERHALAYGRAKTDREFGTIIRGEESRAVPLEKSGSKPVKKPAPKKAPASRSTPRARRRGRTRGI